MDHFAFAGLDDERKKKRIKNIVKSDRDSVTVIHLSILDNYACASGYCGD